MNHTEFSAAVSRLRFASGSPPISIEGARMVLVEGKGQREAARLLGISNTAVQAAIKRVAAAVCTTGASTDEPGLMEGEKDAVR